MRVNTRTATLILFGLCACRIASAGQADVVVYPAPQGSPVSSDYAVTVEGRDLAVYGVPTRYGSNPACFSYFDLSDPVTISVTVNFLSGKAITNLTVHPLSLGITAQRQGNRFTFKASHPGSVTLLVNGDHKNRPLHLFLNPPAEAPPKDAIVFGPGKHVLGYDHPITLTNGQALYIAGGAWVEGIVRAAGARNIRILGRGVLCQSQAQGKDYQGHASAPSGIQLKDCQDVGIGGIVETRAINGWCSVVVNCDRVQLKDYHVLAPVIWSTDGFNICNSRDVTVERSFFRTGDDCISIKGNTGGNVLKEPHIPPSSQPPVENITIRNCTFWNDSNEVIAIGAETRARYFRNIRIQNCDVLFHLKAQDLGVFGILPLHGTEISDILYEDIRVEHCENQLFCFRFIDGIWKIPGDQTFPGTISNVTIRNLSVGYQAKGPRSEFTGWAADKPVQNVTIEGLRYGAKAIQDAAGMGLRTNAFVKRVVFAPASTLRVLAVPP